VAKVPRVLAAVLMAMAASSPGGAQTDPWGSQPFPDPLRMASLPLDSAQAVVPPAGRWQISVASAYFNVWQSTWHAGTIHREFGLLGTPFTPREVAILAQRHPHDQFYFMDLEGTDTVVNVGVGLGGGFALTLRMPWIEVGTPHWDAIAEEFHSHLGLSNMRRDFFPRGQTVIVVRGNHAIVERFGDDVGSGPGDTSVALAARVGAWLGGEHELVAALEAPTGEPGTLRGSGGWDAGVRWFGTWGGPRRQVRFGLGYTWLDPAGSWLGVRRDDTWHALAEAHLPLGRLTLRYSLRLDSSPLSSFTDSEIGKASTYWTLGLLGAGWRDAWWAFDAGENFPSRAEVPDFSIHLLFGTRL
jgi:Protein of unknown function (DUF3187)